MEDKIAIYGKNIEVSDRINSYVISKIGKVGRILSDVDEVRVDLANMKNVRNAQDRYSAQITIRGKGYILRTEEKTDDLSSAVDAASDKMMRQIERFKGKRARGRGDGAALGQTLAEPVAEEAEAAPQIVRRKKFAVLPMSEYEAIDQMQLSAHDDFFVFYNAETSAINILYKRNDGTYGVLVPEIG
jgi:putative sigma-54 modulation protein